MKGKLLKERINEALEISGLTEKKKEKVKKFSGGMKRRLNIAIGILNHPKVLILDEPTVGIDPQSRNHIFTFIKRISKEWGTTVIYTSHYMEEVEELCNRVFIIDLGQEIAYGTKNEIILTIDKYFKMGNVLSVLENRNIEIKKISYEEVKLEDVFLTLTGKSLRD